MTRTVGTGASPAGERQRPAHLVFGAGAFAAGVASMALFVAWQALLPEREAAVIGTALRPRAVAVNLALVAGFGLVHSLLAREGVRRRVAAVLPPLLERSLYTLTAAVQLVALVVLWRPLPGVVWEVGPAPLRAGLWTLHALGWLVAVAGFHAAGATHLFGLAQARASAAGRPYVDPPLVTSGLYSWIRHPLYAGTLVALWSVPTMTGGRLLLAATLTAYIGIGARLEERDLARRHGEVYRAYRAEVPGYLPGDSGRGRSRSRSD